MLIKSNVKSWLKLRIILPIGFFIFLMPASSIAQNDSTALRNKKIIADGFKQWENGVGNLFPLVADTVKWTIEGAGQSKEGYESISKTFTSKKQLMDANIKSLYVKFQGIITPKVLGLYADGDMVIAYWKGFAKTKDGKLFANSYAWFMKMKDGKIIELTAFLDMVVMEKILQSKQ